MELDYYLILIKQVILGFGLMSDNLFTRLITRDLVPINHLALGLIAFAVCGGLRLDQMKRLGEGILSIAFVQALATFLAVTGAVMLVAPFTAEGLLKGAWPKSALPLALVLGGIATATAPAATVAVIRQLKSKGPFTTTLLATVAIDDAIALLIFAFGLTIAESLLGAASGGLLAVWLGPLTRLLASLLVGVLVGLAHHLVARRIKR